MQSSDKNESAEILAKLIDKSENTVFFGGAGVSTESGIPDFRSKDGLYNQKYDVPPEMIISHTYFTSHPDKFYAFYKDKMLPEGVKPNAAHLALAALEREGKLQALVTQNIDTLHRDAGSRNILELHGSVSRNYCMRCRRLYDEKFIKRSVGVPLCECGGIVKPDVVLYEESLDEKTTSAAVKAIAEAELLIVAGTSLTVYPAAGFIRYFGGGSLVLINRDPTPMDSLATHILRIPVAELFAEVMKKLKIKI